jgi:hypothetical protein
MYKAETRQWPTWLVPYALCFGSRMSFEWFNCRNLLRKVLLDATRRWAFKTPDVSFHRRKKYRMSEKDCTLFYLFFPRCPVCGEWCKLHWLVLDTLSFDLNTRRSRGHNIFKMAPTKQKAFCAVEYAKTTRYNLFRTPCRRNHVFHIYHSSSSSSWILNYLCRCVS